MFGIDDLLERLIKCKRLSEDAVIPTRGTEDSAGWDLYAIETSLIYPRDHKLIRTGIAMEIPKGYFGMVVGRSGNTIKRGIVVPVGVIDSDYRSDIGVMAFNETGNNIIINKGERIGQIIFQKLPLFKLYETSELSDTERGSNGFGSTGL